MSEANFKITKCELIPSKGSSLKENHSIKNGNPIIKYHESIDSPSISMSVSFIDIDQVISQKGITGGEFIDITVQIEGFDDFIINADKQRLMLNSVKDVVQNTNQQQATLEFISVEAIVNETARVNKKFTGNISETVSKLLTNKRGSDKKGIQSTKKLDKDQTANSYSFVGNLKKPFDTITWLQAKSQASKKSFGFLFFETLDGYRFKSIENLLKQTPVVYEQPDRPVEGPFRIIENNLNESNDIFVNVRMGMYANKTIYVDIEKQTKEVVDFKVGDLKLKKKLEGPNEIENYPSRLMLQVIDPGVAQKGSLFKRVQPVSELAKYQNKSYIRNQMLFSQSLTISIPINPDLRAGDMIEIKLPLKKDDKTDKTDSYGSEKDNDVSGKYLIHTLQHTIGIEKSETHLTLIRDTFTA